MCSSANKHPERLFQLRFQLRTLLYVMSVRCVIFAICSLLNTEGGFAVFELMFFLSMTALMLLSLWLSTRNSPRYLGILLLCHLSIAALLLAGPIAAYHINGRAWYDYGWTSRDPPLFLFRDGTIGISDYDPKFTMPGVWPVVGPIWIMLSFLLSIGLMIFPPVAPVVAVTTPVLSFRLRYMLTSRQTVYAWNLWLIGLLPVLYMVCWGGRVLEWIAD